MTELRGTLAPVPASIQGLRSRVVRATGRVASDTADRAVNHAVDLSMRLTRRRHWSRLAAAATDPARAQAKVLAQILKDNQTTSFGQRHHFGSITSAAEFRARVPIQDYESLRPLIEHQEQTGSRTLTADQPVLYAQTSGTSGNPKYVPITEASIGRVARTQRLFASAVHARSAMFAGKLVGIGSPAVEGTLPGGSSFGSASGLVYEGMPSLVRRKYVIPPEVLAIVDHEARYLAIAALCAAESDVTGVATANPSTLLRLRSIMVEAWDDLVTTVEHGRLGALLEPGSLSDDQWAAVEARLRPDPARARQLARMGRGQRADLGFHHLWPHLAAIATWTGGSCGFALNALRPHLDSGTKIVELGYSASELRGSVGIDPDTNLCVPLLEDNWFEFVDRDRREASDQALGPEDFLGLHQLDTRPGHQYYLYVTTFDGLYRYDMNDIVEVTGTFHDTPTIAFVQKGRGVTNITGEKLTEAQVLEAVEQSQAELGVALPFFVMLADEAAARYRLLAETPPGSELAPGLATLVDDRLRATNIEYGSKRASDRLDSVVGVDLTPGSGDRYRAHLVAGGQRDAQFKFLCLQYRHQCPFFDTISHPSDDEHDGSDR